MVLGRPVDPEKGFALAQGVVLQDFAGQALLVDLGGERVFQLNETGARVAQLLVEGRTLDEMLAKLAQEFDAGSEELAGDVSDLLAELLEQGLVVKQ